MTAVDTPRGCGADGCKRKHYGRGLCKTHYLRAWTDGTLHQHKRTLVAPGASLDERLRNIGWNVTASGCWEWKGARNRSGYGFMATGRHAGDDPQKTIPSMAPRVAYAAWVGPIAEGLVVRHRCDNPPCINPEHLELGTKADNNRDAFLRRRTANGERKSSHKLTDQQVSEVRRRYAADPQPYRVLASEFGVSAALIGAIVRGDRRKRPTNPPLRPAS